MDPQKFCFFFFKNRSQILAITVFGPRCLLEASKSFPRASQEPPKSLPRAVQGPSRGTQEPSRSPHAASKRVSEGRVASCPCRCIWNCSLELECLCQCNLSHSSPITIKDFFACHLTLHWLRILLRSSSTIYVFDSFTDWFACLSLRGGVVFIFSSRISQECLYIIFRCGCQSL